MDYIVADIRFSLPDELLAGHFAQALAPFAASAKGAADLRLCRRERLAPAADYCEIESFDFADADADCRFGRDAEGYLLEMTPRGGGPSASFRMRPGASEALTDYTLHHHPALLRFGVWTIFNLVAVARQRLAIHSSVLLFRGGAVLVLGESGTGKSTHTRLWREHIPGAGLLNDDSPIVRIDAGGGIAEACGSPWSGKVPCYRNEHYPIRAFLRLSQAPHNRIRKLRPVEAIGALLPSCPPTFAHDRELLDSTCAVVSALLARVPCYHLECLPDAEAARLSCRTIFADENLF